MVTSQLAIGRLTDRKVSLVDVTTTGSVVDPPREVDLSAIPGDIHEARFEPRRRLLYLTHTYLGGWYADNSGPGHHISVVDVDTCNIRTVFDLSAGDRSAQGAHDLWIDSDRDRIWACVEQSNDLPGGLISLDPDSGKIQGHITAETRAAHWFCVTPDRSRAFTANKEAPFISVLDLDTEQFVGRVEVPGSEGIAAGLHDRVFVAGPCRVPGAPPGPPGIRVINTTTLQVEQVLVMDHAPGAVHVTATGMVLAAELRTATGQGRPIDGVLHLIDGDTLDTLGQIPIGAAVLTITSSTDGQLAFIADSWGGVVTVVDLRAGHVITTITNQPGAHGLAWIATDR